MLPGLSGQYHLYRLATALNRLRALPTGASEGQLRELVPQFGSATPDNSISAVDLRRAVQAAFDAHRQR